MTLLDHPFARLAVGSVAGAALGFGFYALIGCRTGLCPLTSNPWSASFGGALLGAILARG